MPHWQNKVIPFLFHADDISQYTIECIMFITCVHLNDIKLHVEAIF